MDNNIQPDEQNTSFNEQPIKIPEVSQQTETVQSQQGNVSNLQSSPGQVIQPINTQPTSQPSNPQPVTTNQPATNNIQPQSQAVAQPTSKTDVLGILSIIFAIIFAPIGLILGIVGIFRAKSQKYSPVLSIIGFVMSLIVAVIVAILFAISFVAYDTVANKSLQVERIADVKAISISLEAYYANNGHYPTLSELNDPTWRQNNDINVMEQTLTDPQNTFATLTATPTKDSYTYQAYTADGADCKISINCKKFIITYTAQNDNSETGFATYQSMN